MFEKARIRKEHLEDLEYQITRLERQRALAEPTDPAYQIICENLARLYEERDNYLTPFLGKPEAKTILLHGLIAGGTAFALANVEQLHPITTKLFSTATRGIFDKPRRV